MIVTPVDGGWMCHLLGSGFSRPAELDEWARDNLLVPTLSWGLGFYQDDKGLGYYAQLSIVVKCEQDLTMMHLSF